MPNSWGQSTFFEEGVLNLLSALVQQTRYIYHVDPWEHDERYRVDTQTGLIEVWNEGDDEVGMAPRWEQYQ